MASSKLRKATALALASLGGIVLALKSRPGTPDTVSLDKRSLCADGSVLLKHRKTAARVRHGTRLCSVLLADPRRHRNRLLFRGPGAHASANVRDGGCIGQCDAGILVRYLLNTICRTFAGAKSPRLRYGIPFTHLAGGHTCGSGRWGREYGTPREQPLASGCGWSGSLGSARYWRAAQHALTANRILARRAASFGLRSAWNQRQGNQLQAHH